MVRAVPGLAGPDADRADRPGRVHVRQGSGADPSGDLDTSAPTELNTRLQTIYPKATFMLVANAGHDAAAPFQSACAGPAVGRFFDTLPADANACTTVTG